MKRILLAMCMFVLAICVSPLQSEASLADGKYNLPYQVNNSGSTSASYGNDYFLKPATLVIKNGQMYVQLTIKNSMWIHTFNGGEGGNSVISRNDGADTRVVQFNISNPMGKTMATMKVDIDELNYHHEYSVDFVWAGNQATLIESYAAAPAPVEPKPAAVAPTQPQTQPKPAEQKPVTATKAIETKAIAEAKTEVKKEEAVKEQSEETKVPEKNEEDIGVAVASEKEQETKEEEAVEVATQETEKEKVNETTEVAIEVTDDQDSSSSVIFGLAVIAIALFGSIGYIIFRKKAKAT